MSLTSRACRWGSDLSLCGIDIDIKSASDPSAQTLIMARSISEILGAGGNSAIALARHVGGRHSWLHVATECPYKSEDLRFQQAWDSTRSKFAL